MKKVTSYIYFDSNPQARSVSEVDRTAVDVFTAEMSYLRGFF